MVHPGLAVITTVTPNPARDVTYRVPQVRIGQSHRVEVLGTRAGGKGMNCAGVLASMETPHRALAIVGEADREWWERDAAHRGICSEALVVAEPHRVRLSTALVHEDHEVTVLNEPGLGPPPAAWRGLVDASVATAEALDVIAWCGSVPAQAPEAMLADAVHRGVVSGAHVVIDGSGTWLLAAVAAGPAIVTVNRQ
ncbi:MAG: PfkB family carbohydrate kinase, partial [Ornithinimicrobium sp.]